MAYDPRVAVWPTDPICYSVPSQMVVQKSANPKIDYACFLILLLPKMFMPGHSLHQSARSDRLYLCGDTPVPRSRIGYVGVGTYQGTYPDIAEGDKHGNSTSARNSKFYLNNDNSTLLSIIRIPCALAWYPDTGHCLGTSKNS